MHCLNESLGPTIHYIMMVMNIIIALSYFAIPAAIVWIMVRYPFIQLKWILCLFVAFITLCGFTHLISVLDPKGSVTVLTLVVYTATAFVSSLTSVLLWVFNKKCGLALSYVFRLHHA